jgi:hypothetical protein
MPIPRWKRFRLASTILCAALVGAPFFVAMPRAASPGTNLPVETTESQQLSRITSVSITGSQSTGTFGGVAYQRVWGTVSGVVAPRDTIEGFDQLPHDADGNYDYQSEFEIIAPEKAGTNSAIFVEVENRGRPVFYNALQEVEVAGPPSATANGGDPGNGFLFEHGTSYARVQWQTGIAASVPVQAEGVGEVIIRDFGRMLAGHTQLAAKPPAEFGPYRTVILGGISLSGFFIDTYLAEGFNADPSDGGVVYEGAIAVDGTGNWIAINELAAEAGVKEFPYVVPDGKPLRASQILGGHVSDPYYTRTPRRRATRVPGAPAPAAATAACPRTSIPFHTTPTCARWRWSSSMSSTFPPLGKSRSCHPRLSLRWTPIPRYSECRTLIR